MYYLDASLMLARYLGEPRREEAESIWHGDHEFFTSALTVAETVVSLRRSVASRPGKRKTRWLHAVLSRSEADFQLVSIVFDLTEPIQIVRQEARLSSCRGSDAVHVATALWLYRETGRPVTVASFDSRQREVAALCGLQLLPVK